jgi:hypothetical protein
MSSLPAKAVASVEYRRVRDGSILASLAVLLNAGPMLFLGARMGYALNITTEKRKFMSTTRVLK